MSSKKYECHDSIQMPSQMYRILKLKCQWCAFSESLPCESTSPHSRYYRRIFYLVGATFEYTFECLAHSLRRLYEQMYRHTCVEQSEDILVKRSSSIQGSCGSFGDPVRFFLLMHLLVIQVFTSQYQMNIYNDERVPFSVPGGCQWTFEAIAVWPSRFP